MTRINQSSDVWKSRTIDWILETTKCWTASWCLANIGGIANNWSISAISGHWIADVVCAIVVVVTFVRDLATIDRIANVCAAKIVFTTRKLSELANRGSILKNTFSSCAFIRSSTVDTCHNTSCNSIGCNTNAVLARIGWWRTKIRIILTFWSWISVFINRSSTSIIHCARIVVITVD